MAKFNIFKGSRPSEGARNLKASLPNSLILRHRGSKYRGREGRVFINWGCSLIPQELLEGGHVILNKPSAVANASNKLRYYELLWNNEETRHLLTPFTTSLSAALSLVQQGGRVYARRNLQGHGGEGIELIVNSRDSEIEAFRQLRRSGAYPVHVSGIDVLAPLRDIPLFTQGISGNRIEYRIHVFKGRAILVQAKRRREGARAATGYNSLVRNLASGWIYAVNDIPQEGVEAATAAAILAVQAVGLDFGAVDIIYKVDQGRAYAIEINTAPGLDEDGSALAAYSAAIQEEFA